jgi:hypothetical protein
MLGIPAALGGDAVIEAVCAESNDPVHLEIRNGRISAHGDTPNAPAAVLGGGYETLSELRIHFPLPFARWYEDLIHT